MKNIKLFKNLVENAQSIVISTHLYPDADGIGSQVALCLALRAYNKNAICVNEEALLERYCYLAPRGIIISQKEYQKKHGDKKIDLFVVVDANSPTRIGNNTERLLSQAKKFLYIDHHPAPPAVHALHCINTCAAATGQVVGKLIEALGIDFTQEMGLAIYTAILIDTSSFRYPTVTGETHRLVAKMIDTGISPPNAYNSVNGTKRVAHLQILGEVLASAQNNKSEEVAWITVKESCIKKHKVDMEDTHSFINHLLVLDNIKVACMFRDVGKYTKISFRSSGNIDVGAIAQALGGGGHNHSAATVIEGNLEEVIDQTIQQVELMLKIMAKTG